MIENCPVCGGNKVQKIFYSHFIPAFLVEVFKTQESALKSIKTTVDFVQCTKCCFVYNRMYKYVDYKAEYDVSRSVSGFFREYSVNIIKRILSSIEDYKVKSVVEVGHSMVILQVSL